jgi:hypothetical protein
MIEDGVLALDEVKNIPLTVDDNGVVVLVAPNMLDEDVEGTLLIVLNEGNKVDIV